MDNSITHKIERKAFEKALDAMDLMRSKRIPFGVSICYTSKNYLTVTSDVFLDMLIEKGCIFAWYFHYMPVADKLWEEDQAAEAALLKKSDF